MAHTGQKRPWLAALLALAYPGLGHLYLRSWVRAMMWFGLISTAAVVLVPSAAVGAAGSAGAAAEAAWAAVLGLDVRTKGLLAAMVATEAFDAYMVALRGRGRARDADAESCPNCGKALQEDLGFCHWCSADRPE